MCGINGFNFSNKELLQKMNEETAHRGPDFSGLFVDEDISVGHNLLAIREVSEISKQPYTSESGYTEQDGDWIMAFNGQIYNTERLVKYLQASGVTLDRSKLKLDTYIIYKLIELDGYLFANKIFGMFAIALYNKKSKMLRLYRDSSGQKNLYYYFKSGKFIFSSEIKGILAHENLDEKVDEFAISLAVTFGYIPGERTLFENIKKVEPGKYVEISLQNIDFPTPSVGDIKPEVENYFNGDFKDVLKELMAEHLQSKDKISINLSGGLDSTLILHEAKENNYIVDSYTTFFEIAGDEKTFNQDALLARRLSTDYGTTHKEIKITKENYLENFVDAYASVEEPNYNISLPVYYITAKTEGIHGDGKRVVLSGDGGDEVFGGYSYYLQNQIIENKINLLTPFIYETLRYFRSKILGQKYESNTDTSTRWFFFKDLKKHFVKKYSTAEIIFYLKKIMSDYKSKFARKQGGIYECMLADRIFWMSGENFIRSDKLYMSQSLELRSPLAYEPFREYCDRVIQNNQYIDKTQNKIFLRNYAENVLPNYIVHRENKTGWRAPVEIWYDENYKKTFLEILHKAKNNGGGIIEWDEVIKRVEASTTWPKKWIHIYLSIAILANKFNLKI